LPKFLVNSAILTSGKNPKTCAEGALKMLARGKIKGIEAKSCYCCGQEERVALIIEAPNQETLLEVLQEKINLPVASITEIEEVPTPTQ
jgi:hypothetical protein